MKTSRLRGRTDCFGSCAAAMTERRDTLGNRLFIGGLSWDTDDSGLRTAFEPFGELDDVKVITDRDSGRSRGFGFVTFADPGDAQSAMTAMDGSVLDGRSLRVNEANQRERSGGRGRF
jgi:RNA recognition motif-containing protein